MKVCFLAGSNPHALATARHFTTLGIDCFGIGRGPIKPEPLWQSPKNYRYYQAAVGTENGVFFSILDRERPQVIVNLCAQGEGAASFGKDAWRFYQTNTVYLAQLVESLRHRDYLDRFIHVSTSELYGSTEEPAAEDDPIRATSPYSISKAAFDQHLEVMHRIHGFPMQIVRPSNCVTAGMQLHRIVPRAAICAVYGQKLKLQGGGQARKSFMDTEDLAKGLLLVYEKGVVGGTYNCGPENPVSIRELVQLVAERSGVPWADFVDEVPARTGEDSCYWLHSAKIRALGWKPDVSRGTMIDRVIEWARRYPEVAGMPHDYSVTP